MVHKLKEKKELFDDKIQTERIPVIHISVDSLNITVEEGRVYRGSFLVTSENQIPMKGQIYSTNDKMELENTELIGVRQEIPFFFKGKLATAGNEFDGNFVIITNGGEYKIPYHICVVSKTVETSIGPIGNMEEFTKLYLENRKEAMELFFLPNFSEVFLKKEPEQQELYHSLMKSRSRNVILEEFLTAAEYKPVTALCVEEKPLVLDSGKNQVTLTLKLTAPGYLEGQIRSEKGQVQLSAKRFTSEDFTDGVLEIQVEKNHNYAMGSDVISISTIRQEFAIPVEWWGTLPAYTREQEKAGRIKKQRAELMHNYLYFRTGSIGFEDFAEESHHVLDDLFFLTQNVEWKLYLMHLLLMEESMEDAKELLQQIEASRQEKELSELAQQYLLYLKAMLYRTPEAIGEAVTSIRAFYEVTSHKAEALWMLIYLDREYVYNKRLQYDTMKQLFQEGNNSCLLYFEACEILNENPNYMEEAGPFEVSIFRWGVRYGYISMSLAYQFARLALKLKYYSNSIFYIAEKLYRVEPDERFLQVICSLLIKGNRTGKEYHEYFRQAVEANLKIIGLNEFFIRSMDVDNYEKIPQRVLIYFTYSNSLDSTERAYLYTNILKNKDFYDEVFGAYYSKMVPFVEEQLLKGKMNEHLAYLYTCFQEEILEKPENTKAVCDILFYQKLTCHNRNMIGVYVANPETGEENYYPFSGNSCYAQIVNSHCVLYFVDSTEQRYVSDVEYELCPFLQLSQFPEEWVQKNLSNKKILLTMTDRVCGAMEEKDLPVMKRIVFHEDYQPWIKERILEKLLTYYENHQKKTELENWLERTDYSSVSTDFRKTLMDYYMEVGMIENAYFGIELYGCQIMGTAKRLKLATFGVHHCEWKKDQTVLYLTYASFVGRKYNRDTLKYLMMYFDGELQELLAIWEKSSKFGLETKEFEKKILNRSMFTGSDEEGLFQVFSSFYENSREDVLVCRFLRYLSERELEGNVKLPDSIHRIIGEEIQTGRIRDSRAKVSFLYYFAEKREWHDQIRPVVTELLEEFLKAGEYLPVFYSYRNWVELPEDYTERTFLTYKGEKGKEVILYYQIDGEEEVSREQKLVEMIPGMYTASMHFYRSDHVNYRLEADGEQVSDQDHIVFETFEYDGEESRFFALNNLTVGEDCEDKMREYLQKAYFADQFMKPL